MPNAKNIAIVNELSARFEKASVAALLDYRGLNAQETEDLRSEARKAGVELRVKKNRLIKLALKNVGSQTPEAALKNPTMLAFGNGHPGAVPKMILEFGKKNEKLKIKGGIFEKRALSAAEVVELASMPTKDVLLARLLGSISPSNSLGRMLRSIKNPASKLVRSLQAVAEKKTA